MKRLLLVCAAAMLSCSLVSAANNSIYYDLEDKGVINIHVSDIENTTDLTREQIADLQKRIAKALSDRRSLTFKVVPASQAEYELNISLKEYYWTEEDPIDMITSAPLAVYDAVTDENYVRMMGEFSLTDKQSGEVLWKDFVKATKSDADMKEDEAFDIASGEIVKNFIAEAFSKKKSKK